MTAKFHPHKRPSDLCAQWYEDDGVDPRLAFRRRRSTRENASRKTLQLCKQAQTALSSALRGESGDALLAELDVAEVLPAPDDRRLRVLIRLPVSATFAGAAEVRERLEAAKSWLRCEVAAAITRKRAPQLSFELLPPGEYPPVQESEESIAPPRVLEFDSAGSAPRDEALRVAAVQDSVAPAALPVAGEQPVGSLPKVRAWLVEPLPAELRQSIERLGRAEDVEHVVLLPDVHLAIGVCIGTVIATRRLLYPQAVGSDIGCGMTTVALDAPESLLAREASAQTVLDTWRDAVPIIRHRRRDASPTLPDVLLTEPLSDPSLARTAEREGRIEFGTLGRGNHFLEMQTDEEGRTWLLVHSGSRAMGQVITRWHLQRANRGAGGLSYLDAETEAGRAYVGDVAWAERYAEWNRRHILRAALEHLGRRFPVSARWETLFGGSHNHLRREDHFGLARWVHRKGANSARTDEACVIPGSIATPTFHVLGRGVEAALCSSSHGAGRSLSRGDARRRISVRRLKQELGDVWFNERLADGLCEEAPAAYKDIEAVMRAQRDLVRIVRRLRPRLSFKGV